nr:type II toxin-antitoxin system RelE/ParE family toxin [Luteimonas sp. Y-2-2-4F]
MSRKAEEDVIAIFVHGARQFGLHQAERYHDLLDRAFGFLADNPEAGRERTEITPAVRMHPVESHIVLYKVDESGDLLILRVRHSREDWLQED